MISLDENKVLVTGGAGFIGSHLIERLLSDGKEVFVFDLIPLDRALNLREVKDHPKMHYFEGDIRNVEHVKEFFVSDASMIFHLAAVVGIKHYLDDPLKLIDITVGGTRTILELAKENGNKVIFTSTSEVFGRNPKIPWSETDDRVLGPTSVDRWCYSSSKAVCEHMIYGMYHKFNLPFSIIRFFNAYGPRQNPIFVMSQSVYKALRGEKPLLYDDGSMTRCFTYIDDIIEGVIRIANNPKAVGESFNLGNTVETTMKNVVESVIKAVDPCLGYDVFNTVDKYGDIYEDIGRRVPDASKAKEMLDWHAVTQYQEGIEKTVEWSKKNPWWLEG